MNQNQETEALVSEGKNPRGFAYNLAQVTNCGFSLDPKITKKLWEESIMEIFPDDVYVINIEGEVVILVYIYSYLTRKEVREYQELIDDLVKEVAKLYDTKVELLFCYNEDTDCFSASGHNGE